MPSAPDTAGSEVADKPPSITAHETLDHLVSRARRSSIPLRVRFLQRETKNGIRAGPLADLVRSGDRRGLLLYLLLLTKASGGDYAVTLPAAVWARALGLWNPEGPTATSAISKTWRRLEDIRLIERERDNRRTRVRPLLEDGSGEPYTHPGEAKVRHLKVPHTVWTSGPEGDRRWFEVLDLAETATLLISLSLRPGFHLPYEKAPSWYGISADTAKRGFDGLVDHGLLLRRLHYKKAPLTARGYTGQYQYTLTGPFARTKAGSVTGSP